MFCSTSSLNMIPIRKNTTGPPLDYDFDIERSVQFPGAHGEEIVRDVFTDIHVCIHFNSHPLILGIRTHLLQIANTTSQTNTTYTCGEDSHIRAWKSSADTATMEIDPSKPMSDKKEKRKEKKEKRKGERERFKPY